MDLKEYGTFNRVKVFEQHDKDLEQKIEKLRGILADPKIKKNEKISLGKDIDKLESVRREKLLEVFSSLTAFDRVFLARHVDRPQTLEYIRGITDRFIELHGDRQTGDDQAIVGGLGEINGKYLMIIGHQKGNDIYSRKKHNFGYANPEGYRKALRLMKQAEKFGWPIVTLVDTPAAACDVKEEEHGISQAIANNLKGMFGITVPILSIITGQGGSGGAIGLAVADRVLMLEHAIYSVIPPEGCAKILYPKEAEDPEFREKVFSESAEQLKLTSHDALKQGIIDAIIEEPFGGAHRDHEGIIMAVKAVILSELHYLMSQPAIGQRLDERFERFRRMGEYEEL